MIAPLLLYDGTCGFCAASVQFILRHERHAVLRFAPLQSDLAAAIRGRHPELDGVDSMVWVETGGGGQGERVAIRSDAALEVARYLGWPWRALAAGWLVPRGLRDGVYDLVARHRHRLFSDPEACYLPPADVRSRFIDS